MSRSCSICRCVFTGPECSPDLRQMKRKRWKREGQHPQPACGEALSLSASLLGKGREAAPVRQERSAGVSELLAATAHNTFSHELLAVSLRLPAGGWLADKARKLPRRIPAAPGARVSDRARPGPWGNG